MESYYWLSFCDGDRPKGSQFLGVVITRAPSFVAAVIKSHALGINPGGEVAGGDIGQQDGIEAYTDRLLPRDEAEQLAKIVR